MPSAYNFIKSILLLLLFSMAINAQANCITNRNNTAPADVYYTATSVVVSRDFPVGGEISRLTPSSVTQPGSRGYINCNNGGGYEYYQIGPLFTTADAGYSHVYATNVAGVGIKIPAVWSNTFFDNPRSAFSIYAPAGISYSVNPSTVYLVKTGNITSGVLSSGIIGTVAGDDGVVAQTLHYTGSSVTQIGCSLTTTSLTFPIGNVQASSFGTAVGTIPAGGQNTQSLGLECDPNTNIMVKLNGTQNPDVGTPSVMALTGQGTTGVASGVGVQLLYNDVPLNLNSQITLKTSAGGVESLPLTARYYQTSSSVIPGAANASATLEITYQ